MQRDGSTDPLGDIADISYKYWAFISYSHHDADWAKWLHKRIEAYRLPTKSVQHSEAETGIPSKLAPVFRDQDELPTSADLGRIITRNLEASRHLIVICSPNAAQSRWVNEEILTFKRLGRSDRIHLLIVGGEPNASADHNTTAKECFPSAAVHRLDATGALSGEKAEPLAADARPGRDSRHDAMLRLISGMLGLGFDELKRRDLQRRQRRLLGSMIATIVLALTMLALAFAAIMGQREAARQRDTAKERLARNYWTNAVAQRDSYHDLIKAGHYFARAATEFPTSSPQAENARLAAAASVQSSRLEHILTHSDAVVGARFNAEESRLLTWCKDGSVTLWDPLSGEQLQQVTHDRWVDHAVFVRDGTCILSEGRDGAIRLWDTKTGRMLLDLRHSGEVQGTVLSQDESQLLSWATDEEAVLLWNLETGDVSRRLPHAVQPLGATFNKAEDRILTWGYGGHDGYGGSVCLWSRDSNEPVQVLKRNTPCQHAAFCRDDKAALVSCGKAVFLWYPAEDRVVDVSKFGGALDLDYSMSGIDNANFDSRVNGAVFDAEERRVLSWSANGTVQVWGAREGTLATFRHTGPVSGAAFSSDPRRILSWSRDGSARLWDTETKKAIGRFNHAYQVHGATFAGRDDRVLTWSGDGTCQLWDVETMRPLLQFRHAGPVFGAAFSHDRRRLLTWGFDKTLRIWNLTPSIQFTDFKHDELVWRAQFNGDFSRLLTASGDKTARLWDVATGTDLQQYAHEHTVYGAEFNQNESRVLTWSRDGIARMSEAETGAPLATIEHDDGVIRALFINTSDSFISYGLDRTLRMWDADAQRETVIAVNVSQVAFAPDARHVVSWSRDANSVRLLASKTGTTVATWPWKQNERIGAVFDATGERALVWDSDQGARVFSVRTGNELVQLDTPYTLQYAKFDHGGHRIVGWHLDEPVGMWDAASGTLLFAISRQRPVVDITFSGDDARMLVICEDGSAQLWDTSTGHALVQMKGSQWDHLPLFSRDGHRLLTTHRDGATRLWDTRFGDLLVELGRDHTAGGGIFGDRNQVLTWYQDGTTRLWDVGTQAFLNSQSPTRSVEVLTGTRLNEFDELQVLTEEAWQDCR